MTDCPICYDEFSTEGELIPLVLDCGHSVCQQCIMGILQNRSRGQQDSKCPLCKHKLRNSSIADFKKNYSLLEAIEKKKEIQEEEDACRCSEKPSFYCKRCKKYLCHVCTQNHLGHPIVAFDHESIVTRSKAEGFVRKLNQTTDRISNSLDTLESAKRDVVSKAKENKKLISKFINTAKRILERVEEQLEDDIEIGLSKSLKSIESSVSLLSESLQTLTSHREDILAKLLPFTNDEKIMNRSDKQEIDRLVDESTESLASVFSGLPGHSDVPVYRFKAEGPDITANRISAALIDSYRVVSVPIKVDLLARRSGGLTSLGNRKLTM